MILHNGRCYTMQELKRIVLSFLNIITNDLIRKVCSLPGNLCKISSFNFSDVTFLAVRMIELHLFPLKSENTATTIFETKNSKGTSIIPFSLEKVLCNVPFPN